MNMKKIKIKIWIEDDEKIFGKGNYELLKAIEECGSIKQAAKKLNMSYKKAWLKKEQTQDFLGGEIFISKKGASLDSGTKLSPRAKGFLDFYTELEKELEENANIKFKEKKENE